MVMARCRARSGSGAAGSPARHGPAGRIEVLSRRSLGRHIALLVVRVADRTLLVGQSSQQMTLLAELDGERVGAHPTSATRLEVRGETETASGHEDGCQGWHRRTETHSGAWDAFMDRLREMTVRR